LFRDEYVVHLYNAEDDGHYLGVYCGDDLNKAQEIYERKLAHYRGEKIMTCPHNLFDALNHVRLTNLCNMSDIVMVTEILEDYAIAQRHRR